MSKHRHHQAHNRREQFVSNPPRSPRVSANVVIVAAAVVLLAAVLFATRTREHNVPVPVSSLAAGQDVSFAAADFDDGLARFYRYVTAAGKEIRFFVMKSSDGVLRAAFDTCDVCYRERRGYRQSGDDMICNNCGKAFPSRNVNVLQGGCNPAPLDRVVEGDRIVLRAVALEQGAFYF